MSEPQRGVIAREAETLRAFVAIDLKSGSAERFSRKSRLSSQSVMSLGG
jgi:hypothetical protein